MTSLKKSIDMLSRLSRRQVAAFGAQYDAFGIFIFVFYLANPLKWQFSGPYTFSIIASLRAGAVVLWIALALWRYWPKKLQRHLPLFWHFCLFYHLPFRTIFSTLYSSHSRSFDSFGLLGIVALALLVDDRTFCVLTILGTIIGSMVYFAFGGMDIALVKLPTLIYAALMILSIAFFKLVFFRNHNLSLHEKSKAYKTLAGAIAHEVRAPISTLNLMLENLIDIKESVQEMQAKIIQRQAQKALQIVDSILLQVRYIESSQPAKRKKHSLMQCIMAAVNDVHFSDADRVKIIINATQDYLVLVDQKLLVHIFLNLIKNALWAIKGFPDGKIDITLANSSRGIAVTIADNGIGISHRDQRFIFEPFRGKNQNGAGIGLAFCKLALKNMHGSISYEARAGRLTCFTINLCRPVP